jgi:hypothetical protein
MLSNPKKKGKKKEGVFSHPYNFPTQSMEFYTWKLFQQIWLVRSD